MVKEKDTWQFANCHFGFQRPPLELAPLIFPSQRFWLTAGSWWKWWNLSSYIFFMSLLSPWEFSSARDKFTVGKKNVSLPSELIFPSNILEEKCWWWNVCRWGGYQTLGVRQCSTQSNYPDVLHSNLSKWNVVKNLINNFLEGKKSLHLVSLLVSLISHPVFRPWQNKTWKVESMWKALTLI